MRAGLLPGYDVGRCLLDDDVPALAQSAKQRRLAAARRTGQHIPLGQVASLLHPSD